MKLLTLILHNFKGIRDLTLDAQGRNVSIYGDNGTGKTTIVDAQSWLLFGKDSQNKKAFSIKTIDPETGETIPGIDHSVEGVYQLNSGKKLTLKKLFKEQWTKKRGSATATFTGHTIDHFIDGVPVPEKEYLEYIAKLIDEGIFKLLTNPRHFNDQLHWEKRRQILLEVCGDVTDGEVIASDKALSRLPEILGDRSMDQHRKVIAACRNEINKELDKIPTRIDEATRALPEITGLKKTAIDNELNILNELKKSKEQQKLRIESGGEIAEKQKALRVLEGELQDLKNTLRADIDQQINQEREDLSSLTTEIDQLEIQIINPKTRAISSNESEIKRLNGERETLRAKWLEVSALEFEHDEEDVCPTCGQAIPSDQLEAAREKALEIFNRVKAEDLEKINAKGKVIKAEVERLTQHNAELQGEIAQAEHHMEELAAKKDEIQARINDLKTKATDTETDPAYQEKLEGKTILQTAIAALKDDNTDALSTVEAEIKEASDKIEVLESQLDDLKNHAKGQERIEELKTRERELAKEYESLEEEQFLCDEFTRSKVKLLDSKINSRFKLARFKLFDVQVNGGIAECCETLGDSVPWSTGLNNGAQINVGIDIINTLSDHYQFTAPILADNAESVTAIIPTRAQLIRLVVSEPDKKLRVEYEGTAKQQTLIKGES